VRGARTILAAIVVAALVVVAVGSLAPTFAAFASRADNGEEPGGTIGNRVAAAPDFRPPAVGAVAIGKTAGGSAGFVKPGGTYNVYANVAADTGNPPSGIASVKANVAALTAGSTAVMLTAGTYSFAGTSYNYRTAAPLTAAAPLAEGSKAFSVTATDVATNAASANGSATVDDTAPKASDVQTTNAGTNGLAEQNDTLVFTFSEPIEPESVLAGWTGAATNVVVRVNDGVLAVVGNDTVQIFNAANTTALPLGLVDLGRSDYVTGVLGGSVRFGATGAPSTMTMSANTITVVLGTYNATIIVDPVRITALAAGTSTWTPVATPFDRAANATSTTPATESGAADKEF
jgi:hypothetical protein